MVLPRLTWSDEPSSFSFCQKISLNTTQSCKPIKSYKNLQRNDKTKKISSTNDESSKIRFESKKKELDRRWKNCLQIFKNDSEQVVCDLMNHVWKNVFSKINNIIKNIKKGLREKKIYSCWRWDTKVSEKSHVWFK